VNYGTVEDISAAEAPSGSRRRRIRSATKKHKRGNGSATAERRLLFRVRSSSQRASHPQGTSWVHEHRVWTVRQKALPLHHGQCLTEAGRRHVSVFGRRLRWECGTIPTITGGIMGERGNAHHRQRSSPSSLPSALVGAQ